MNTGTGLTSIEMRKSEDDMSLETIMNMMHLRYTSDLHSVDWKNLIRRSFPLLPNHRKDSILHIGGEYSINPLVLLTKVLLDEEENSSYSQRSDKEFSKNLKQFANKLSIHYQEGCLPNDEPQISPTEYSFTKVVQDDNKTLTKFMYTYHKMAKRYDLPVKLQRKVSKRDDSQGISLVLPFSKDECWTMSGNISFDLNSVN